MAGRSRAAGAGQGWHLLLGGRHATLSMHSMVAACAASRAPHLPPPLALPPRVAAPSPHPPTHTSTHPPRPCLPAAQVRERAAAVGVSVAGENALPCFMPNIIDETALHRIVYNTQVCGCGGGGGGGLELLWWLLFVCGDGRKRVCLCPALAHAMASRGGGRGAEGLSARLLPACCAPPHPPQPPRPPCPATLQPWGTPLQTGAGSSGLDPAGPAAAAQAAAAAVSLGAAQAAQAAQAAAAAGSGAVAAMDTGSGGSSPVVPSPGSSTDSLTANGGGRGAAGARVSTPLPCAALAAAAEGLRGSLP